MLRVFFLSLYNRKLHFCVSILFFLLLFLPFKLMLPLLSLDYLLPVISGFYACIITSAFFLIDNKSKLLNFFQFVCIFTLAFVLGCIAFWCKQYEFVYFLFAFLPLADTGLKECFVYLPSKIALFADNNSTSSTPPSNSPLPEWTQFGPSPSQSPTPPPQPWTFEQILWMQRYRSLEDAKRLDIAKRILLQKIIDANSLSLGKNIPNEIQQKIQDNVWGNHWYYLYSNHYHHDTNGNIVPNTRNTPPII